MRFIGASAGVKLLSPRACRFKGANAVHGTGTTKYLFQGVGTRFSFYVPMPVLMLV